MLLDLLLADKSSPDLTNNQQSILIRLLIASVRKITVEESKKKATTERVCVWKSCVRQGRALQLTDALCYRVYMKGEMTVAFCKEVPSLLMRYQSDMEKLALIVELIPMLSLSADVVGPHISYVNDLLEKLKQAYMMNGGENVLLALSQAIQHLLQAEHEVVKRETEVTIREIAQEVMDQLEQSVEGDARILESGHDNESTATPSKRRAKASAKELSDVDFALRTSLTRLTCLIRYVGVREYLPSELSSVPGDEALHRAEDGSKRVKRVDRMAKIVARLADLIHRRTRNILQLREEFRQSDTIKHALLVLYLDLLWLTKAIFKDVEERNKHNLESGEQRGALNEAADRSIREQIERVLKSRTVLEDCFVSVLEMHLEKTQRSGDEDSEEKGGEAQPAEMEEIEFENEDILTYVKEAQRAAFLTFCDTRCLFVEKFEDATPPFDALHWPLPRIMVLLTQMYFENEMETADGVEPEHENGVDEHQPGVGVSEADQVRKAELLAALGKVSISNPSNRRQSAAVLRYFTENAKVSVDVVKAFSRHMKNETPVRYLEVQMTALRQQFNSILALKGELLALSSSKDDEDSRQELQESVDVSEAQLKELAKKLSQSLGVGKIAPGLRAPFFRFLCEGVRYSLERREQFAFLEPLRSYLGHLDPSSMKQLRGYFMQLLEEMNETPESEDELSQEWRIVFDFQSAISVKKKERQVPASIPTRAAVKPLEPAGGGENMSANGDGGEELAAASTKRKRSLDMDDNDLSGKDGTEKDTEASVDAPEQSEDGTRELEQSASPTKRQRRLMMGSPEHKIDDDHTQQAESEAEETTDASPLASPRGKKRGVVDAEQNEATSTRTNPLKLKQARHEEQGDAVETNGAGQSAAATDTQEQPPVESVDEEMDSRRARRRRRSVLTG